MLISCHQSQVQALVNTIAPTGSALIGNPKLISMSVLSADIKLLRCHHWFAQVSGLALSLTCISKFRVMNSRRHSSLLRSWSLFLNVSLICCMVSTASFSRLSFANSPCIAAFRSSTHVLSALTWAFSRR